MQAEFKGEVLLSRKSGDLRLLGSMETIRGKDFIYGTTFNIEKGNFVFDNIEKIDPKLDFLVSTPLTGSALVTTDSVTKAEPVRGVETRKSNLGSIFSILSKTKLPFS